LLPLRAFSERQNTEHFSNLIKVSFNNEFRQIKRF
jgi:hypothetical protein